MSWGQPPGGHYGHDYNAGYQQNYGGQPYSPAGAPPGYAHGPPGMVPPGQYPPGNMPNFDMNASVIRMAHQPGADRSSSNTEPVGGGGGRRGLGHHDRNDAGRLPRYGDSFVPLSFEESRRLLYIGNITDAWGDEAQIRMVLNAGMQPGNGLRRFFRLARHTGEPCSFAYAEYDTSDAVLIALEVLKDAKLPKPGFNNGVANNENGDAHDQNGESKANGEDAVKAEASKEDEVNGETTGHKEKKKDPKLPEHIARSSDADDADSPWTQLKPHVDEKSLQFFGNYQRDQDALDQAIAYSKQELQRILHNIAHPPTAAGQNGQYRNETGQIVDLPMPSGSENDLSHVPDELREQIVVEIKRFRQRASLREELKKAKDKDMEAEIRRRQMAKLTNTQEADTSGNEPEKSLADTLLDLPPGYGPCGTTPSSGLRPLTAEELRGDFSDDEVERRRQHDKSVREEAEARKAEEEYSRMEARRIDGMERQRRAAEAEERDREVTRRDNEEFYLNWDGNANSGRGRAYRDHDFNHSKWVSNIKPRLKKESAADEEDRYQEAKEEDAAARAKGEDPSNGANVKQKSQPIAPRERVQLGLSAAAKRVQERDEQAQKALHGIESLLGSQQEEERGPLRLRRLQDEGDKPVDNGNPAVKLASSIPSEKDALFAWKVQYDHVNEAMVNDKLRPYVEKQVLNHIGVADKYLINKIITGIQQQTAPQVICDDIREAIGVEEESTDMVMKTWRMLVFFTEAEKLGIEA